VEEIIRANAAQGVTNFFVTDDNFARNRNWESILDRIISLRENEGFKPSLIFQVDTLCHRIPGFIEKVARAGCISVFIGLENINPESLMASKKRQNKIWEYREMLLAWRRAGVITCAGYILGFPTDTPASIARDIETIQRELPIDILEFFLLTPLPGSEDHKSMYMAGVSMDTDMNRYDLEHACADHPTMDRTTLERVYRDAWSLYYTDSHVETLIRRAAVSSLRSQRKLIDDLTLFPAPFASRTFTRCNSDCFAARLEPSGGMGCRSSIPFYFILLDLVRSSKVRSGGFGCSRTIGASPQDSRRSGRQGLYRSCTDARGIRGNLTRGFCRRVRCEDPQHARCSEEDRRRVIILFALERVLRRGRC
jgi:hypothetical protein